MADVLVRLKASNLLWPTAKIYLYDYQLADWVQFDSSTVSGSEMERRRTVSTNASRYRNSNGQVRLRVNGTRSGSTTFDLSLDEVSVTLR
jgi:hypothetical protein